MELTPELPAARRDNRGNGIGELVSRHRMAAGLTQEELALRAGLSVRTVSDIERGRTNRPHRSSVDLLCRALGLNAVAADPAPVTVMRDPGPPAPEPAGPPAHPGGASLTQAVPRQLPPGIRCLSGRDRESAALDMLLSRGNAGQDTVGICVISGTAGVGKTALAVQWAHQACERFPDGQLFADLHGFGPSGTPLRPAGVLADFIEALQPPASQIPPSLDSLTSRYRSLLAGKRVLIVLDNARDAAQVRPLLPGAAGCAVIVTSRCQLTSLVAAHDAGSLTLGLLSEAEACDMLSSRLRPDRVTGQAGTLRELANLCARLPAALAIVAARATLGPSQMLPALAEELRDPRGRLDALDAREMSARAMFSWSYRALSDPAARMFRLLGYHPGPDITLTGAASLAGVSLARARETLSELTGANMLAEPVPGRFACHDLLRVYASGQPALP